MVRLGEGIGFGDGMEGSTRWKYKSDWFGEGIRFREGVDGIKELQEGSMFWFGLLKVSSLVTVSDLVKV